MVVILHREAGKEMLKNILCFGDSNTYGFIAGSGGRYDENTRWTRLLQKHLGLEYYIIEEGLNGRTTVYDDDTMKHVNGSNYLEVCIASNRPLDLVIIMLGTNDTKDRFHASAKDIAKGMEELIKILRSPGLYDKGILIVSPIHISDKIGFSEYNESFGGQKGAEKSRLLANEYKVLADKYGCHFMDAADYAKADDKDAIHLDAKGHAKLAEALYHKIKEIETALM
jgi:lysophospholipase L1-like esterase